MLRRKEAKGTLHVSEETPEADMKSIVKGGKYLFLRDLCLKMDKGEEEEVSSGQEADDESPATSSRSSKRSESCDLVAERGPLTPGKYLGLVGMPEDLRAQKSRVQTFLGPRTLGRNRINGTRICEWIKHDSEAERCLSEKEDRVRAANGNREIDRSEGDKVCQRTQHNEEAEQEEAKRMEEQIVRNLDDDFDLQTVRPDSIKWIFDGMSLSNSGK